MLRLAVMAVGVASVLLAVAGCGSDPFVGSWSMGSGSSGGSTPNLVIARAGDNYRFTFVDASTPTHWSTLKRDGDTLKVAWSYPAQSGVPAQHHWITLTLTDGKLTFRQDGLDPSKPIVATKLSDATSLPLPLASQ
jgi:hypothetical protein